MARFFIDRPIFAWVIAIIMMMAGALAIYTLPVEQYPAVAPPAVTIAGNYPGPRQNRGRLGHPGD